MILSDGSLRARVRELFPRDYNTMDLDTQIQPASVDLRLGPVFYVYKDLLAPQHRTIRVGEDDASEYMERVEAKEFFVLQPGVFALGSTVETVNVPNDMVCRVDGRSSLGRLGIKIHSTAGWCDPGFFGCITLEIDSVSRFPLQLRVGMRVCQVSFQMLDRDALKPYGAARNSKYLNAKGVEPSMIHRDEDKT